MDKTHLIDAYIHHRNLYNKGKGELGWMNELIRTAFLAGAFATPEILRENLLIATAFYLAWQFVCYFVGWWWEERRYFRNEAQWANANKRNDLAEEIRKAIK